MSFSQFNAESALNSLLSGFTGVTVTYDNMPFTPSVTEPYVHVTHIPGVKRQATLGSCGLNRICGTMVMYVSYPVGAEYIGTYEPNRTAETLVALFERGTSATYDCVTVTCERAQRKAPLEGDTRYTPVVEVAWYAYVPKDEVETPPDEGETPPEPAP